MSGLLSSGSAFRPGRLTATHDARVLFALCWLVYCASYLGRINFSSAMPEMLDAGAVTAASAGWINTAYFAAYGLGNIVNGLAADRTHPARLVFVGLGVSAAANLLMPVFDDVRLLAFFWCVNGWAQAMIWAPILRIFSLMLTERDKVNACVNIVSSQIAGTLLSYLLSAAILLIASWRMVFVAPAVLMAAAGVVWLRGFSETLRRAAPAAPAAEGAGPKTEPADVPLSSVFFGTGFLMLVWPALVHGTLKDGLTAWIPTYLGEVFSLSSSAALVITAAVPVMNLSGAYMARIVYRHTDGNVMLSTAVFMAAACASLAALNLAGGLHVLAAALFLALAAAFMMAVNTLLVSVYPLRFEKLGRVSSVSGLLNALGYAGAAVSMAATGLCVERFGWSAALCVWLGLTLSAAALGFAAARRTPRKA